MNVSSKTRERQDDDRASARSPRATSTAASRYQVYVSDTLWTFDEENGREEFEKHLQQRAALRQFLESGARKVHESKFLNLDTAIQEPRRSTYQRVRGMVRRSVLAVMLLDLILTIYQSRNRISRPPGSLVGSIAEFVLSKKTVELVVTPIISDLQVEYCEALAADRKTKAGWVRLRGYWSLFKALGLYSIVKMFFEMWRKLSSG